MLTTLEETARVAGAIVLSYFHKESHITHKTSHNDLVTAADIASQQCIHDTITKKLVQKGISENEIGFISEENLSTRNATHMFVIDPLDGTNNFASGLDYFAVSIAYFNKGVLTDSVIYWPVRDTMYSASKGKGAYKKDAHGKKVKLTVKDDLLENSVILTYISSHKEYHQKQMVFIEKILVRVRGLRLYGSACIDLVHLADGENTVHIVFYAHIYLWDFAAAYLIIDESGGVCTDLSGKVITLDVTSSKREYELLAAHPNVIKELKKYLPQPFI
ncbi:MAG: inositol monophosphatase [bacterium]